MKISREDGEFACGCRSVSECFHGIFTDPEPRALDLLVDEFAKAMKAKLRKKYEEGYRGWDDDPDFTREKIVRLIKEHLPKGDPVDIANFAAFMWNMEEGTGERSNEDETKG